MSQDGQKNPPSSSPVSTGAWLGPLLASLRPLIAEVALASAFVNLLALAVPIFVLQVYDRVIQHTGLSTLTGLVIGMVLVIAFDFILRQTRARIMRTVSLNIDVKAGRKLYDKISTLPLRTLESRPVGAWQQLFRDLDTIRNTLAGSSAALVFDLPFAVLFLVVIFLIANPIFWVMVLGVISFLTLTWLSARSISQAGNREHTVQQSRDALMAETIMGRTTIKALAMETMQRNRWEDRQAHTIDHASRRGSLTDMFVNLGQSLSIAITVAITTVGALAILDQKMTIGALIAANMLSSRLFAPLNQLVGAWQVYSGFRESTSRLNRLFGEEEERGHSVITQERPKGHLTVEALTFRYRADTRPVLDTISLTLKPGHLIAVMGRNGCGKTTLLKVLLGLYRPDDGRVLLDGADIAQFTRAELATWMGYVPQECVLFSGSIRDNIVHGMPAASDAQVLEAAKLSGVHAFVVDLPDGYATDVGESGALLSGGMRQRLSIARALLADPPILLLDEPSSNLDRPAEEALAATLADLARDKLVVVVSHSPSLLQESARLIVLESGRIAASGPTRDVMAALNRKGTAARQTSATPVLIKPPAQPGAGGSS